MSWRSRRILAPLDDNGAPLRIDAQRVKELNHLLHQIRKDFFSRLHIGALNPVAIPEAQATYRTRTRELLKFDWLHNDRHNLDFYVNLLIVLKATSRGARYHSNFIGASYTDWKARWGRFRATHRTRLYIAYGCYVSANELFDRHEPLLGFVVKPLPDSNY